MLNALPELRDRLNEARAMSPIWSALIDRWADQVYLLYHECPNIDDMHARGKAPETYKLMRSIIDPIEYPNRPVRV